MPNPTSKKHLEVKAFYLASLEVNVFYDNYILYGTFPRKKELYIYNLVNGYIY